MIRDKSALAGQQKRFPLESSLRDVFRLRRQESLRGRLVRPRVFEWKEKWGLVDVSGALWPVDIRGDSTDLRPWMKLSCVQRESLQPDTPLVFEILSKEDFEPQRSSPLLSALVSWLSLLALDTVLEGSGAVSEPTRFVASSPFPQLDRHALFQKAKQATRQFFLAREYRELEAPLLVESGGIERYLGLFETQYVDSRGTSKTFQLPTSPEFALKKSLAQGYPRVFSLAPSFRNDGERSPWHRPEFLMLEWYTAGQSLEALIEQTLALMSYLVDKLGLPRARGVQAAQVLKIEDLYRERFGVELRQLLAPSRRQDLFQALSPLSISLRPDDSVDVLFWKSFLDVIEPQVLKKRGPVILTGFPVGYASLAKPAPDGLFAERFELFFDGVEICNGYHELTDASLAKQRFESLGSERTGLRRDGDFEDALECGIGRCSGNALGLERLISCLMGLEELGFGTGLPPFGTEFSV